MSRTIKVPRLWLRSVFLSSSDGDLFAFTQSRSQPLERFWRYLKDQAYTNHLEGIIACGLVQAE